MATNSVNGLRNSETQIQGKPGLIQRFARAYWEVNERLYLAAITDSKTGHTNPAVERQVVLMMLLG